MDDIRVGRVIRAIRRRRGWRQQDLASRAGCAQTTISLIERGHLANVRLRRLRDVAIALEAEAIVDVRWRGGAVDRLVDERHAALEGAIAGVLAAAGWQVQVEVSYSHYGERGSIDVLAWHAPGRQLLVIEVKSELVSVEATLRKLDEKQRLASIVARERLDWEASGVSRLLVLPDVSVERRRVHRAGPVLEPALPDRTVACRRWLLQPEGRLSGIWFMAAKRVRADRPGSGGRERVRCPTKASISTG